MRLFFVVFVFCAVAAGVSFAQSLPQVHEGASPPYDGMPDAAPAQPPLCGHQDLVGKFIKDIDTEGLGIVRVLYPDSIVTEDFNPERINLILEKETDKILEVVCG